MDEIAIVCIAFYAFLGGLTTAALGFLKSNEPFDWRKLSASLLRSLIAAVMLALTYSQKTDFSILDMFTAFLGGAGIDGIGNRLVGAIKAKVKK